MRVVLRQRAPATLRLRYQPGLVGPRGPQGEPGPPVSAEDFATKAEAEAGTSADKVMSPLRASEAIVAKARSGLWAQPATGAASRTIEAKLRETFDLLDFANPSDADSTGAFLRGLAHLESIGGGLLNAPRATLAISETVWIKKSDIGIVGKGRGGSHDANPVNTAATSVIWRGPNGGKMFRVADEGLPTSQRVTGWCFNDINLVAGDWPLTSVAGRGLEIDSAAHGEARLRTYEFGDRAVNMTVHTGIAEQSLCENNKIDLIFRQINKSGTALVLDGVMECDPCFNDFWVEGKYHNGIGVDLKVCDNNNFWKLVPVRTPTGTGTPLIFRGRKAGMDMGAFGNIVWYMSQVIFGGKIIAEGTEVAGNAEASHNRIVMFDSFNGAPDLQIGTGATLYVGSNNHPPQVQLGSAKALACSANLNSVNFAFGSGAAEQIPFSVKNVGESWLDPVTHFIVPPLPGVYRFEARAFVNVDASSPIGADITIQLRKRGVTVHQEMLRTAYAGASNMTVAVSGLIECDGFDWIDASVRVLNGVAGTAATVSGLPVHTSFSCQRVA